MLENTGILIQQAYGMI